MKSRLIAIGIAFIALLVIVMLNKKEVQLTAQNSFALQKLGAMGYQLSSTLHLNNPNLLSSTIVSIDEQYTIGNTQVAELNIELNQGIPGRKETALPVEVRIAAGDLPGGQGNAVPVHISGHIVYKNFTGGGTINVDITDTLSLSN